MSRVSSSTGCAENGISRRDRNRGAWQGWVSASLIGLWSCGIPSRSTPPREPTARHVASAQRPGATVGTTGAAARTHLEQLAEPGAANAEAAGELGLQEPPARVQHPPVFTELELPGFASSLLSVPVQHERELWMLAAHGAGDTPHAQCEYWRELLGAARGLLACPAGRLIHHDGTRGYYYADHLQLEREVFALLGVLRSQHAWVGARPGLYAAYSQGASMGVLMLVEHGSTFPRLLLIEGGYGEWTASRARRFRATGGSRVAFVCGTPLCRQRAAHAVEWLERAGVTAQLWHEPGAGHVYWGHISKQVKRAFDWLRAG